LAEQIYAKLEPYLSLLRWVRHGDPDAACLYLSSTIIRREPPALTLLWNSAAELDQVCDNWGDGLTTHKAALDAVTEAAELVAGSMVETDGLEAILTTLESWLTSRSAMLTLHQAIICSSPVHKSVILDAMDELEEGQKYAKVSDDQDIERALVLLQTYVIAHEQKMVEQKPPEPSINPNDYQVFDCPIAPGVLMRTIYIPTNSDEDLRKMCKARGMVILESKPPTTMEMVNYLLKMAGPNSWEC
jgi:hypothetical protein